jgi:Na+-driven multidrug efflux pump
LHFISAAFIAQGLVFTCSGLFQGLGNTRPALASSALRIALFVPTVVWLTTRPSFEIHHVWYVSVATAWIQAGVSVWLLRRYIAARRGNLVARARGPAGAAPAGATAAVAAAAVLSTAAAGDVEA